MIMEGYESHTLQNPDSSEGLNIEVPGFNNKPGGPGQLFAPGRGLFADTVIPLNIPTSTNSNGRSSDLGLPDQDLFTPNAEPTITATSLINENDSFGPAPTFSFAPDPAVFADDVKPKQTQTPANPENNANSNKPIATGIHPYNSGNTGNPKNNQQLPPTNPNVVGNNAESKTLRSSIRHCFLRRWELWVATADCFSGCLCFQSC